MDSTITRFRGAVQTENKMLREKLINKNDQQIVYKFIFININFELLFKIVGQTKRRGFERKSSIRSNNDNVCL
jgi:hypothetical protein